jgi:hypothetical protein
VGGGGVAVVLLHEDMGVREARGKVGRRETTVAATTRGSKKAWPRLLQREHRAVHGDPRCRKVLQ